MENWTSLRTDDLPAKDRVARWVEALCENMNEVRVEPKHGEVFSAAVSIGGFGALGATFLETSEERVRRTNAMISRGKLEQFFLHQALSRPIRFSQQGRQVVLRPGEVTLIDGRFPYLIEHSADNVGLNITLPADWVHTWSTAAESHAGAVWSSGCGWGGVLASSLLSLNMAALRSMPDGRGEWLENHLGSLLALATHDQSAQASRSEENLITAVRDTIRSSFYDPGLSAPAAAKRHGISTRQLHLLFARHGGSFAEEVASRRLDCALRMLREPSFDNVALQEVAIRSGFRNASHFAKRFRLRYGFSPGEARRLHRH